MLGGYAKTTSQLYRARDAKLGRDVAIKVLPETFARDRDRTERFQGEGV
jgi:eukaryotic-like serine/threonine-protein kinase